MPTSIVLAVVSVVALAVLIYYVLDLRYRALFQRWVNEYGASAGRKAIEGSQAAITGRVLEKFAPYVQDFGFNPRDARFIGDPVDFVIFDGLSEGQVKGVVFLEVKSGAGALNGNERKVKAAIAEKRVEWQLFRLPDARAVPAATEE